MSLLNRRGPFAATVQPAAGRSEAGQIVPPTVAAEVQPGPEAAAVSSTPSRGVTVVTAQSGTHRVQKADITELERLSKNDALVEFRSLRSFDYSAALLFDGETPAYYVALYHEGNLWRSFTMSDLASAEATFRQIEEQIARMTDGEITRAQLTAEHERIRREIAQAEARAERLCCDIERNVMYTQLVSAKQHEVRKELVQLEAQRVSAQVQLDRTLRHVHSLGLTNNESIPHPQIRRDDVLRR